MTRIRIKLTKKIRFLMKYLVESEKSTIFAVSNNKTIKTMAKCNIIEFFTRFDLSHELKLVVYENKSGFRGSLQNTYGKVIESRSFGKGASIDYIKASFGFNDSNSY